MKKTALSLLFPAAVAMLFLAAAGPASAVEPAAEESVYFEAAVSRADRVVARPHALTRLGADARISFQDGMASQPRLGLRYRVDVGPDGRYHAAIVALVNNQQVATHALAMTRDEGGDVILEGGGYVWQVRADAMTPAFLARLRAAQR